MNQTASTTKTMQNTALNCQTTHFDNSMKVGTIISPSNVKGVPLYCESPEKALDAGLTCFANTLIGTVCGDTQTTAVSSDKATTYCCDLTVHGRM
jgi:hypothetical protein